MIAIMNPAGETIGLVDTFESVSWTSRYTKAGSFTLKLGVTERHRALFQKENLVSFGNRTGFIHTVQLEISEGSERMTVIGQDLIGYLGRRINWDIFVFSGTVEGFMREIVRRNCIDTEQKRMIPRLRLGALKGYPDPLQKQDSYGNLRKVLEDLAAESEHGFSLRLDRETKDLIFEVYKGENRTVNQTVLPPVIFSREFENIMEQTYFDSLEEMKNTVKIGGEGEGTARIFEHLGDSSGLERRELFVDAADLRSDEEETPLNPEAYAAILRQRGREVLADYPAVQTFDSVLNPITARGYQLGDMVTLRDGRWNVTADARITEIEEIFEKSGRTLNVTFGHAIPTIFNKLRRVSYGGKE